ncbi:MAG: hypothetical protein Alis3KO_26950 [Aliiglaciecola sp.]|uniref:hypothetical protein n=1 Tax=Aliiglaciecola sp. M165 TaxID=2593649 RepID=UPI00117FD526|nr:hypothetical protein [Aliiglaciecola sp. M165]TRY30670.1 hypothetical protein FM019_12315 [Aliiglaciecola sp. M165]
MNIKSAKTHLLTIFSLLLFSWGIAGCQSTEETQEAPECRAEVPENCEAATGDDRGYDPCLVNKNLPVCKT